jgi:hypothetical protein
VAYSRKPGKRCPFSNILPRCTLDVRLSSPNFGGKDDGQIPARNVCRASSAAYRIACRWRRI